MSTYDDSSLFLYPSGYKASVLFAQKPMDANGQLAFTRSNDTATRVASNGLIEKVRTNVVTYSQDFSDASWTKTAITISTSATANPVNGALTAQDAIPTATLSAHRIFKLAGVVSTPNTWSIYAKAKGYNFITIVENGNTSANVCFNLSTGAISSQNSAVGQIQSLGNGWYRCSMIHTTSTTPRFDVYVSPTDSLAAYTADGTSGVTLFGAQAEASDFGATPYIPTTTAAVSVGPVANIPRIDYLGGGCGKLLLEPQRTNSITSSENISTGWTYTNTAISLNQTASPDGYVNADAIVPDATSGQHAINSVNITASGSFTLSAFVKAGEYTKVAIRESANTGSYASFNLATGTKIEDNVSGASFIQSYGNGWYRIGVTGTFSGTIRLGINVLSNAYTTGNPSSGTTFFSGNASNKLFCWGMQAELGATYATSYIPTLAASVTRGADACSKTGISSLIGQTEGTIFVDFQLNQAPSDINGRLLQLWATNDTTNAIIPIVNQSLQLQITTFGASAGTAIISAGPSTLLGLGQNKIAVAYTSTSVVVYRNGVLFASGNPTGFFPTSLTSLDLGGSSFAARNLGNPINQALLFKTRLPNSELAALTAL